MVAWCGVVYEGAGGWGVGVLHSVVRRGCERRGKGWRIQGLRLTCVLS